MSQWSDRLASEGATLLAQFQNNRPGANCIATATALQNFLDSGVIQPARVTMGGFGFINCGDAFHHASINAVLRVVRRGGDGFHVIVGGRNGDRQHYANLVNVHGTVHYADAYTRPAQWNTDPTGYLRWLRGHLEYSTHVIARFVPQGMSARCPPRH